MIIASFGLYGISFRRGKLFGNMRQYPLLSIQFLLVSIAFIRGNPVGVFREAIKGLSEDQEWLVRNARTIRIAKAKAKGKARAQMEAQYRADIDRAWERVSEESRKSGELQNEVYALRRVIKGMQQEPSHD